MINKRTLLVLLAIVVLLVGYLIYKQPKKQEAPKELPHEVTVSLTEEGFSPREVTIQSGSAVRFTNDTSTDSASVNSDDYPTNKKYPELNLGIFQKGSTLVHIFTQTGTYTYHDQFNPEHTGTIMVQ